MYILLEGGPFNARAAGGEADQATAPQSWSELEQALLSENPRVYGQAEKAVTRKGVGVLENLVILMIKRNDHSGATRSFSAITSIRRSVGDKQFADALNRLAETSTSQEVREICRLLHLADPGDLFVFDRDSTPAKKKIMAFHRSPFESVRWLATRSMSWESLDMFANGMTSTFLNYPKSRKWAPDYVECLMRSCDDRSQRVREASFLALCWYLYGEYDVQRLGNFLVDKVRRSQVSQRSAHVLSKTLLIILLWRDDSQ